MSLESNRNKDLVGKAADNDHTELDPKQQKISELNATIKDLGGKIREAKAEKKDRAEWDFLLQKMLEAKAGFKELTGIDLSPPSKQKVKKLPPKEASPSDILSDDLLGSVFEFLQPGQFRFIAGTSRQFKRVYEFASNKNTTTSITSVAESISRSRFYFFEEMTYMGPNPRRRKVFRLERRMQKNLVERVDKVLKAFSGNQSVFEHAMKTKANAALVEYKRLYKCPDCEHTNKFRPYHTCGPKPALVDGDEESLHGRNAADLVGHKGMALFGKKRAKWHPCVVKKDNEDGTIKVQWEEDKKFTFNLPVGKFRLLGDTDDVDRYYFECTNCSQPITQDIMSFNEIMPVLVALRGDFSICPSCGDVVVKNGGCDHIACRCGADFSYASGRFC